MEYIKGPLADDGPGAQVMVLFAAAKLPYFEYRQQPITASRFIHNSIYLHRANLLDRIPVLRKIQTTAKVSQSRFDGRMHRYKARD